MTIDEMHEMIKMLKSQGQNGFHTPEQIDRALNSGSYDKFNEEKRLIGSNHYYDTNLAFFTKSATTSAPSASTKIVELPSDYDLLLNAYETTSPFAEVDIVPPSEVASKLSDPIDTGKFCYLVRGTTLQGLYISSGAAINVLYLRKPLTVRWAYNLSGSDYIYDSSTSSQPDWPEAAHVDIVLRALPYLGVSLNDDMLIKLKGYKKQTENV
jgi:hypothetical protein